MLYDPNWKKVKNEPTLEGFITFLETKNPKQNFNFTDPSGCAVAQYLDSINYNRTRGGLITKSIDKIFGQYGVGKTVLPDGYDTFLSFGEALKRARALKTQKDPRPAEAERG